MVKYFKSEVLGKDCKFDTESRTVTVKDLYDFKNEYITYNRNELNIIAHNMGEIDPQVHKIKKMFGGELVKKEKR